ncbi:MAG TPA: helix-turn-helix transcriptional regulator [Gemmatimonadaceae bacterium]|jgi:DNA-binding PadR family transcriptional regulator|nr:helix-turn-helix transcriptional regulator [Gemmatimonadaceae bacterium]
MSDTESTSLSPVSYQILLALAGRERHGYLIRKAVEAQTDGAVQLGPATVYSAIRRLEDNGLIEESPHRPDADLDDQRRRYYRLTRSGRSALRRETDRLQATVAFALRQLKANPNR